MDPQTLALDSSDQDVGVVFEEPDARHGRVDFQPVNWVRGQVDVGRETGDCGIHTRKTADVPDMQASIASDPVESHGQFSGCVERHGLASARDLQPEFQVGIGVVIHSQQVDHACGGSHGNQAGDGGRPVVGGERRQVIVLCELPVLKPPTLGETGRLIELYYTVLQVDVEKGVVCGIGRPLDQPGFWPVHGDSLMREAETKTRREG